MENNRQNSININWFPGHMTKAKREMQEKLKMVDMVIELRDARIPNASHNPMIDELCANKPRLIILSKKDKAEEVCTKEWIKQLRQAQVQVIALDIPKENITKAVLKATNEIMKERLERQKRRGIRPRATRAMVVGVPNVGKSTFINKLVKKHVAQTGDRPGVTRALQWAKVGDQLELLDTPGVLWPKFEDPMVGMYLAACGSIKDNILPLEEVAAWMMCTLCERKGEAIQQRYQVELDKDPYVMFERIARQRGFLMNNQEVDITRTIAIFLKEVRSNQLGRITWEEPYGNSQ
ncbi:MAG: ribosome biogenesis GTPase YlqF [Erysipelotrichaceae bacterium]|nr:ribosome biogenesis GTPase YlqF [Erysipelotrichaceae bacterium]